MWEKHTLAAHSISLNTYFKLRKTYGLAVARLMQHQKQKHDNIPAMAETEAEAEAGLGWKQSIQQSAAWFRKWRIN